MHPINYKAEAADCIHKKIEIWNMILNEVKDETTDNIVIKEYVVRKINDLNKSLEMLQLI